MKKIYALLVIVVLLFTVSGVSFGAIHPTGSVFFDPVGYEIQGTLLIPDNDKWFDSTKTQEGFTGNINLVNTDLTGNFTGLNLEYYKNDQTFAGLNYLSAPEVNFTSVYGEYLFDFGLFVGADYLGNGYGSVGVLSGGYSLKFGDRGYAAVSLDYENDSDTSEILGYEADVLYYLDKAKIFGEIYQLQATNETYFLIGGAYSLTDQLTAGARYMSGTDLTGYEAGVTWTKDALVINGKVAEDPGINETYVSLNGGYQFTKNWSAGITFQKYPDLPLGYLAKVSYKEGIFNFSLSVNSDYYPELFFGD